MLQLPTTSGEKNQRKLKLVFNLLLTVRWCWIQGLAHVLWTDSLRILPKELEILCLEILFESFCCSEKKGWVSLMMHSAVAPIHLIFMSDCCLFFVLFFLLQNIVPSSSNWPHRRNVWGVRCRPSFPLLHAVCGWDWPSLQRIWCYLPAGTRHFYLWLP